MLRRMTSVKLSTTLRIQHLHVHVDGFCFNFKLQSSGCSYEFDGALLGVFERCIN